MGKLAGFSDVYQKSFMQSFFVFDFVLFKQFFITKITMFFANVLAAAYFFLKVGLMAISCL